MKNGILVGLLICLGLFSASCGPGIPDSVMFSGVNADLYRGPGHCDWDGTWLVEINDAQFSVETNGVFPVYVRDPSEMGVFSYAAESDLEAEVPQSAELIGESDRGYQIWFDGNDENLLYLVFGNRVEAWALATDYTGCE